MGQQKSQLMKPLVSWFIATKANKLRRSMAFMLCSDKEFYKAAAYMRLSREDGDKVESDSIQNQRALIKESIKKKQNIKLIDEYVDDGYSGTNFERPAFKKLIEDIGKGKIDCIIVKDLSRLGRNYIETGRYLEKVFPVLGVRFIAITDNYDSTEKNGDADQIIIPFKNLINDAYCRDISTKIRSQLDVKRKNGQFIGSFASYGYAKDEKNKNKLVPDEYAANIVRYIFDLKLDGLSSYDIKDKLNELGVLTPLEYKKLCGFQYNSGFRSKSNPEWSVTTVNRILRNEIYTGTMVQGKHKKISYKVKKSKDMDEANWIRVENTHDAIVSKAEYDLVQILLSRDTRRSPRKNAVYIFSGFIKCGDCGQNMVRRITNKNGKPYAYYHCSTYKAGDGCSSHIISEKHLEELVTQCIRQQVAMVTEAQKILDSIEAQPEEQLSVVLIDKQIATVVSEVERYKDLKVHLYQDLQDGLISRAEYQELNNQFSLKLKKATDNEKTLSDKREELLKTKISVRPWIEEFKQYGNIESLDRKTVVSIIDQIIVGNNHQIEIRFRYDNELKFLLNEARHLAEIKNDDSVERQVIAV